MNCIAIIDDSEILELISEFSGKIEFLNLIGKYRNAFEAFEILHNKKIDVIILDIELPKISGFDFLKMLNKSPIVIFIPSSGKYALDSFEFNAIDYMIRPFTFERFCKSVYKAYNIHCILNNERIDVKTKNNEDFILIKVEYSTVKIYTNEILFVEGLKDYIKIFTNGGIFMTKCTMKHIEEKLMNSYIIRIHKSFLVSLSKIHKIENNRICINDKRIPIGNQYKSIFNKILEKYTL